MTANSATSAIVALHNYLMAIRPHTQSNYSCPAGYPDVETNGLLHVGGRQRGTHSTAGLIPIGCAGSNNYSANAREV